MRRRGLWAACVMLLVGVVGVLAVGTGFANDEDAGAKCSEATLHGTYLLAEDGVVITGKDQIPFAAAGYEVFDGNGNVKSVFSLNFNGQVVDRNVHESGTYTVKADCTGTTKYPHMQNDLFIVHDGSMFTFLHTKTPDVVTSGFDLRGTAQRVDENAEDENAEVRCSEATLHGRYLFAYDGVEIRGDNQIPFAVAGREVRDDKGNIKGVASGNFNGEVFRNEPFSGTYTVNADCTGTNTFTDGTHIDMFIASDGSELTVVQTHPKKSVTSWTTKRVGD